MCPVCAGAVGATHRPGPCGQGARPHSYPCLPTISPASPSAGRRHGLASGNPAVRGYCELRPLLFPWAGITRLDDQIFLNRNPGVPSVVKFHPFTPCVAVADKDSIWCVAVRTCISSG